MALQNGCGEKIINENTHNVRVADQKIISDSAFDFTKWSLRFNYQFVEKHRIQFLVTKSSENLNLIEFSDPQPQHCGYFHLLYFLSDHFVKPKAEKHKIPFLVTKSGEKLNLK